MVRLILSLLLASTISAHAEEQSNWSGSYYCRVTAGAGVKLDPATNRWESIRFNVEDEVQLVTVKPTGSERDGKPSFFIFVKDFGKQGDGYPCLRPEFDDHNERVPISTNGSAFCRYIGWEYDFDFKALKMQTMFRGGYMDPTGEDTDTPYVSVAKCDKVG
jgi:hypothetical protein